jgi:hypothetical protein
MIRQLLWPTVWSCYAAALHARGYAPAEGRQRADEPGAVGSGMSPTATWGLPADRALPSDVPGEGLGAAAEDRGFEPRRVVTPNRISSSGRGRPDRFKLDRRP